ncbi:pilus assembly protein CpaF [Microbacteriaceae bacterium MWH-Ta3]|nr:pilus assembly protein CpaF [Microbacteriaceae bacterium MWH-Ta3]
MFLSRALTVALGPLVGAITPAVRDVCVTARGDVWVDSGAGMVKSESLRLDPATTRFVAVALMELAGRTVDDAHPIGDGAIGHRVRVNVVLPPASPSGVELSLRFHPEAATSLESFVDRHGRSIRDTVSEWVRRGDSILIAGATGAGKTTLARLALELVDHSRRIVIAEDVPELAPQHPHVVSLSTVPPTADGAGAVSLRDLVRSSMRMRPDWLVVGEVRGPEILDMTVALTSGHAGICTVHARTLQDIPARLTALGLMAGVAPNAMAELCAGAFTRMVMCTRAEAGTVATTGSLWLKDSRLVINRD